MSPSFGRSWPIRPCVFGWRSSRQGRVSGHTRPASVCWCFPASVDTCCCLCVLLLEHVSSLWTVLYGKQTRVLLNAWFFSVYSNILCWNQFRCGLKLLFITCVLNCFWDQFAFLKEQHCERVTYWWVLGQDLQELFFFYENYGFHWVWCVSIVLRLLDCSISYGWTSHVY